MSVSAEVTFDGVPLEASVGADQGGTTVHVWRDPASQNVLTRTFDRSGAVVSSAVIARSGDFVGVPSVDVAPNGRWAVAWVQRVGRLRSVQAATFSDPLDTSATRVTAFSTNRNEQTFLENSNAVPATVAVNDSGALAVGYVETLYVKNSSTYSATVQRVSPAGQLVGARVQSTGPWIVSLAVDMNANGQAVAVWENNYSGVSNLGDINGRRFAPDGSAVGGIFAVNTTIPGEDTMPKVAMSASGSFVAAWRHGYEGSTPHVPPRPFARVFGADGTGGAEIHMGRSEVVGTDDYRVTGYPSIAVAPDGTWAAMYSQAHTWDATPEGGPATTAASQSLLLQRYAADGSATGAPEELTHRDAVYLTNTNTMLSESGQRAIAKSLFATAAGEYLGLYRDDPDYDGTHEVLAGKFASL